MSTMINLGLILAGQNIPSLESIPCLGDFSNPMTPKPSPRHVFPAWAGRALPAWWSMPPSLGGGLYVCGPSGCGKSSSIREWCARTGTPLFQVTANGRLEFPDLVGHVSLESDGAGGTKTSFVHGPLARAMRDGGVFLLDEIDLLDPAVCAGLNGVLDGSGLLIPENGGEYIQPHELFRFVATGNSKGRGDDSGAYSGVAVQNAALLDRFSCIEAGWLPRAAEQVVVGSVPGALQGGDADKLFDFDESSTWHTAWGASAVPFEMLIDLGGLSTLDKLHYVGRKDTGNGTIKKATPAAKTKLPRNTSNISVTNCRLFLSIIPISYSTCAFK